MGTFATAKDASKPVCYFDVDEYWGTRSNMFDLRVQVRAEGGAALLAALLAARDPMRFVAMPSFLPF